MSSIEVSEQYDRESNKNKILELLKKIKEFFSKRARERAELKAMKKAPAVFERIQDVEKRVEAMDEQDAIQNDCLRDVAETLAKVTGVLERGELKDASPDRMEQAIDAIDRQLAEVQAKAGERFLMSSDSLEDVFEKTFGRELEDCYKEENDAMVLSSDVKVYVDRTDDGKPNDVYLAVTDTYGNTSVAKVNFQKNAEKGIEKLTLEKVSAYAMQDGTLRLTGMDGRNDLTPMFSPEEEVRIREESTRLETVLSESLFRASQEYLSARKAKGERMLQDMRSISGTAAKPYKQGEFLCINDERGYCVKDRTTGGMLTLSYNKDQKALVGLLHRNVDGFESADEPIEVMRLSREGKTGRYEFMTSPIADKILDTEMVHRYIQNFGIPQEVFDSARYSGSSYQTGGEKLEGDKAKQAILLGDEITKKLRTTAGLEGYHCYTNTGKRKNETNLEIVTPSKSRFIINFDKEGNVKTMHWKGEKGKPSIPIIRRSGKSKIDKVLSTEAFKHPELCACFSITRECLDNVADLMQDSRMKRQVSNMFATRETNIKLEAQARATEWAVMFENAALLNDFKGKVEKGKLVDMICEEIERTTGQYPDIRRRNTIDQSFDNIIYELSQRGTIDDIYGRNYKAQEIRERQKTEGVEIFSSISRSAVRISNEEFERITEGELDGEINALGQQIGGLFKQESYKADLKERMLRIKQEQASGFEIPENELAELMKGEDNAEYFRDNGDTEYTPSERSVSVPVTTDGLETIVAQEIVTPSGETQTTPVLLHDASTDGYWLDNALVSKEMAMEFIKSCVEDDRDRGYSVNAHGMELYEQAAQMPDRTLYASYQDAEQSFSVYEQDGKFYGEINGSLREFPENRLHAVLEKYQAVLTPDGLDKLDAYRQAAKTAEVSAPVAEVEQGVSPEYEQDVTPEYPDYEPQSPDYEPEQDMTPEFEQEIAERAAEVMKPDTPAEPVRVHEPTIRKLDVMLTAAVGAEVLGLSEEKKEELWNAAAKKYGFEDVGTFKSATQTYIAENPHSFASTLKGSEVITDLVSEGLSAEDKGKFAWSGVAAEFREHMFNYEGCMEMAQSLASGKSFEEVVSERQATFEPSESARELTEGTRQFQKWCAEADSSDRGIFQAPEGAKFLEYIKLPFSGEGEFREVPQAKASLMYHEGTLYPNPAIAHHSLTERQANGIARAFNMNGIRNGIPTYITEIRPAKMTVENGEYVLSENGTAYMRDSAPVRENFYASEFPNLTSAPVQPSVPVQQETRTQATPEQIEGVQITTFETPAPAAPEMSAETKQFQKWCAEAETRKGYITPPKDAVFLEYTTRIDGSGSFEQAPMKRASFMYVDGNLYPNPAMNHASMSKEQAAGLAKAFDLPDALPNIQRYISEVKPAKMYIADDGKEGVYTLSEKGTARMQDDKPERKPAKSKQQGVGLD